MIKSTHTTYCRFNCFTNKKACINMYDLVTITNVKSIYILYKLALIWQKGSIYNYNTDFEYLK